MAASAPDDSALAAAVTTAASGFSLGDFSAEALSSFGSLVTVLFDALVDGIEASAPASLGRSGKPLSPDAGSGRPAYRRLDHILVALSTKLLGHYPRHILRDSWPGVHDIFADDIPEQQQSDRDGSRAAQDDLNDGPQRA